MWLNNKEIIIMTQSQKQAIKRLIQLQKQLEAAIKAKNFDLADELRAQIKELKQAIQQDKS